MIINSFDNETEAIINPFDVAQKIDGFPEVAITTFNGYTSTIVADNYATEQMRTFPGSVNPIYKIKYKDKIFAYYRSPVGAPATATCIEEVFAMGCKKILFFGSCGVLNKEIAENSLIVPNAAYRDEGTSYHYAPPSDYIEIKTATRLAEILTELKLPHVCGKTWTTDAPYRETRGNTEKRKQDGCLSVEMECAAIMAVTQFRDIEAYQFLYASDSLDAVKWDKRTFGNMPNSIREKFLRIALEIAMKI